MPFTLQVNSRLVVLDIVVTDRKGNIVHGLSRDDFQVYESKTPQKIRTFEEQRARAADAAVVPVASTADLDRREPNAAVSILVLDEINTSFEDLAFARYSMKKYLSTQGDTLLLPTLLVAVNTQHFEVLRDYTTSKQEVLSALEHHLTNYSMNAIQGPRTDLQFNAVFAALTEVAQATAGHPGHKNVIWIGRGFAQVDPDTLTPEEEDGINKTIQHTTNILRDARITLYTVDPVGVQSLASDSDPDPGSLYDTDPFDGQVNLNTMAKETGGTAFYGRNDVDHLIEKSVQDGTDFYSLSYAPTPSDDPKPFRNIHVLLTNPDLRATTRAGYYPSAPATETAKSELAADPKQQVYDLSLAGASTLVYDSLHFTIERDATAPDTFHLKVMASQIPWQPDSKENLSAGITVLVESFDRKGKMLKRTARVLTVHEPAEAGGGPPSGRGLNIKTEMATAAPAARIRFVLRADGTGKLGANNFLLIDKKEFSDITFGH